MMKAVVLGTVLVVSAGSALAGSPAVSTPDQRFVMNTAWDGMAEVELGKLASEKAMSADVKNFGSRMATARLHRGNDERAPTGRRGLPHRITVGHGRRHQSLGRKDIADGPGSPEGRAITEQAGRNIGQEVEVEVEVNVNSSSTA